MSSFWSIWITVLTLGTLIGCIFLLRWTLTNFTGVKEGESMGHEFDGIEELNNPLPRWWSIFFMVTIIWGFVYLAFYPGLGNFKGIFGWKSSNQGITSIADSKAQTQAAKDAGLAVQYDREVNSAQERFGPIFEGLAKQEYSELVKNEEALRIGQRLFLQNCAQCHGSDGKGTTGFPNLTDDDWLYGGSPEEIEETLLYGRKAQGMIAWKTMLGGEQGVKEVAAYVRSLSGMDVDTELADAGKEKFAMCAACHGSEGQGSHAMGIALGAPRLNDDIWLYGGSPRAVEASIRDGRAGVMPAWKDFLGEDKIRVVSAYVYSLSADKTDNE
ncbi:cytochrome-c oxidase, cbb3-type subunit III [Thalassotalea mangrovi]|uniref:Cbb3-type cytochrome c oxidase subunit n=1 Tax=Thalassotalea mangrovi TaxID=2572245 RepID=A0A4U1B6M5_9GAMM|nr:cytochrome-c oxidase, cbb3-type subunit III [Thalassotalea mangrovi]TKB45827.1 cytochrome-c oxidase, cbb3-type subunit III [Thalassotalea mangrovi]